MFNSKQILARDPMQPIKPMLTAALEDATQQFKAQTTLLEKTQQELIAEKELTTSLQGRIRELQEYINALTTTKEKVEQRAQELLKSLTDQGDAAEKRLRAVEENNLAVYKLIVHGKQSALKIEAYSNIYKWKQQELVQSERFLAESNPEFTKEVELGDSLFTAKNKILINNFLVERSLGYGLDLLGVLKAIKELRHSLEKMQHELDSLHVYQFPNSPPNFPPIDLELLKKIPGDLREARNLMDTLHSMKEFGNLCARARKIAESYHYSISFQLDKSRFPQEYQKALAEIDISEFAHVEQDRYKELRKWMTGDWNWILQQFTTQKIRLNLAELKFWLQYPMASQFETLEALAKEMRTLRKGNTTLESLKEALPIFKSRYLEILKIQAEIKERCQTQLNSRADEKSNYTLVDIIKKEEAQIQEPAEWDNCIINSSDHERELQQQLTELHTEWHTELLTFQTYIKDLVVKTDAKGNDVAEELMRLEVAANSDGVFTYQKTFYALEQADALAIKLGRAPSLPPYRLYWNNPQLGIEVMSAEAGVEKAKRMLLLPS